jgi:hypothetical protein
MILDVDVVDELSITIPQILPIFPPSHPPFPLSPKTY